MSLEGKMTAEGSLEIKRKGVTWKTQDCRYDKTRECGDDCSGFGEPTGSGPYTVTLCEGRVLTFTTFTDNRP